MKKISEYLKKPYSIILGLGRRGFFNWMSDEGYIRFIYRIKIGKKLNLSHPVTFNEKLQWLKLHDREQKYSTLVDKYAVKEYIASAIGSEYVIKTLGKWDTADEIDFAALPDRFVLKANHDSGSVIVCRDKAALDIKAARARLNRGLKYNGFCYGREWPYKSLTPCIIAEEYKEDAKSKDLKDYKFFCFNGKVRCFKIDFDRFTEHHANYFDPDGHLLPFGEVNLPPVYDKKLDLPASLGKMMELAEILSKDIPFVRVDFYDVDGQIYFGELTFYPASGFGIFTSEEWERKLGDWIRLPEK